MALDATISGTDSNSYVTRAEANTYFEDRFENELWDDLTDSKKDALLVTCTLRLDLETYAGVATETTQRLRFPQRIPVSRNYYNYLPTEIPRNLKQAVFELAYFKLQERNLSDIDIYEAQFIKSDKTGPLTTVYRDNMGKMDDLPETVKRELRAIGWSGWQEENKANRVTRLHF